MKTILTEWGEMPLNDWREIKLKDAQWYANRTRTNQRWIVAWKFEIVFSALIYAFTAISWMLHGHIVGCALSLFQGIATVFMGWSFIKLNRTTISEYMLKRQEIVDEVAATMARLK